MSRAFYLLLYRRELIDNKSRLALRLSKVPCLKIVISNGLFEVSNSSYLSKASYQHVEIHRTAQL